MFENICSLPLTSDLFAQAIHPTLPIFSVGLSGGHVQTYRLPSPDQNLVPSNANGYIGASTTNGGRKTSLTIRGRRSSEDGFGTVGTAWRTRRHKGSCRTLAFSGDGNTLYSAGTDGVIKAAETESGRVSSKISLPVDEGASTPADPSIIHVLSPQTLLLGTDTSRLHIFDLRDASFPSSRPCQTFRPHLPSDDLNYAEPITSLTPLPPTAASTSGFARTWVSTAGSTLAATDLRKGIVKVSEDQGDVLLSSACVAGLALTRAETKRRRGNAGAEQADKVLVGGADGVLTFWERGAWEDQSGRVVVHRDSGGGVGEEGTLDALAVVPEVEGRMRVVACGLGNGLVRFVRLGVGANTVVAEVSHDEMRVEGVAALGFDVEGRMVSGGGQVVKLWHEKLAEEEGEEEGSDDEGRSETPRQGGTLEEEDDETVEAAEEGPEVEEEDEDSDDDSEDEQRRRKKKRKGHGKDKGGSHGLRATFKGLD